MVGERGIGERGFTLVEMLVAVGIFALISVASTMVLTQSLDARAALAEQQRLYDQFSQARIILRADAQEGVARATRDQFGSEAELGFEAGYGAAGEALMTMARLGWSNPGLAQERGTVQHVAYYFENGSLIRRSRLRTDPTPETGTVERILLDGLTDARFEFFVGGQWQSQWRSGGYGQPQMPAAMAVVIQHTTLGAVRQVFFMRGTF